MMPFCAEMGSGFGVMACSATPVAYDNSLRFGKLRQTLSASRLHEAGHQGLIVSSGGFASEAEPEIRSSTKHIETMDLKRVITLWQEHYDRLRQSGRPLLPLVKVFLHLPGCGPPISSPARSGVFSLAQVFAIQQEPALDLGPRLEMVAQGLRPPVDPPRRHLCPLPRSCLHDDSAGGGIAGHVSRSMLTHYAHIRTEAKRTALEAIITSKPAASASGPGAVAAAS